MIAEARAKCHQDDVAAELIEGDMLYFSRPDTYDIVLSVFSSFGHFDEAADNARVLDNMYDSLRPGGCLIGEVFGKEFLATRDLKRPQVVDLEGETILVRNVVQDDWSRLHAAWTKIRDGKTTAAYTATATSSKTGSMARLVPSPGAAYRRTRHARSL